MSLNFSSILSQWPLILNGLWMTIALSMASIVLGFVAGTFLAIARRSSSPGLRRFCSVYVEVIRNTPLLIQIFLTYFGLSMIGLTLPAAVVAVIALTINTAAYTSEILRAGLDSIKKGQWEAGEGLGMSTAQIYWHVALFPAIEKVYPSLTSQFVLLMLASSITSQISVEELTAAANFIQSETYRPFEAFITTALIYIVLSLLLRAVLWAVGQAIFPSQRFWRKTI